MDWNEAIREVKTLGPGWRLPTVLDSQLILYPNRSKIPYLQNMNYWSSETLSELPVSFTNDLAFNSNAHNIKYTVAVRTFDGEIALEYLLRDF
jgi:hypothetical protein